MTAVLSVAPKPVSDPTPLTLPSLFGRVVLLATDGSPASNAAARTASALAARSGAVIQVVHVIDSSSGPMPAGMNVAVGIADAMASPSVHAEQVDSVRAELGQAIGTPIEWKIRVALGSPARVIVQEARRLRAALVIVGLRRHGYLERAMQDETTLEVMRHAACPVLGVVGDALALPTRVLAAVDFSQSSLAAARVARTIVADGGSIVLAYSPPVSFDLPDDGEAVVHKLGVAAGFARYRAQLGTDTVTIDQVVLHRALNAPVATTLLEYSSGARCDLIAAGSARRGRLDRWMLGSVSTELVRDGRYSMLIVPPRRVTATRAMAR
ncbi:MAG: universal stress protein [Gemmatimonadaceae bacterium]